MLFSAIKLHIYYVTAISLFSFHLKAHHPDRPPPSFYCHDCYSKMIKEGRADPEMFEDINHPIEQVLIFDIAL
jgi:hypothetical protein